MSRTKLQTMATSLIRDERGTEVIETALLLGMIVCACIFFISALGKKIVGRWDRINEIFDI